MSTDHSTRQIDQIHLYFVVLLYQYLALKWVVHGRPLAASPFPEKMPGWNDTVWSQVIDGRLEGQAALNAMREDYLKWMEGFDSIAKVWETQWVCVRQFKTVAWNGQLYSSAYGALFEVFDEVRDCLRRAKEPEKLAGMLDEIESEADILDLLVAAEQEHAALLKEARGADSIATAGRGETAAAMFEQPAQRVRTAEGICFSADYRSLRWGTETFIFSEKQAAVCRALWEGRQQGTPTLASVTLLDMAESSMADNARPKLSSLFKGHPAWNRVIISAGKGLYKLADPPIA